MGSGVWTANAYATYATSTGRATDCINGVTTLSSNYKAQDLFTSARLQSELNPYKVIRECLDTEEHPNTVPVILALDVTGSMGDAAAEVAKKLNEVMTKLYERVTDVEFMIMGIGDLAYDRAPLQLSQFESDIRIAEQLDKVYFEGGGGGNSYESYTGAWYLGLHHTKLDCWKRGRKGVIITMGDEPLNPYLPKDSLARVTGDNLQGDVETKDLYRDAVEKFDIYHLAVNDRETSFNLYDDEIRETFSKYLDSDHLKVVSLDNIASTIISIVSKCADNVAEEAVCTNMNSEISW